MHEITHWFRCIIAEKVDIFLERAHQFEMARRIFEQGKEKGFIIKQVCSDGICRSKKNNDMFLEAIEEIMGSDEEIGVIFGIDVSGGSNFLNPISENAYLFAESGCILPSYLFTEGPPGIATLGLIEEFLGEYLKKFKIPAFGIGQYETTK